MKLSRRRFLVSSVTLAGAATLPLSLTRLTPPRGIICGPVRIPLEDLYSAIPRIDLTSSGLHTEIRCWSGELRIVEDDGR